MEFIISLNVAGGMVCGHGCMDISLSAQFLSGWKIASGWPFIGSEHTNGRVEVAACACGIVNIAGVAGATRASTKQSAAANKIP
ncbi:MAG: hypothetical protein V1489_01800 [Candidatus Liptonbacteria bacterium]